MYCRAYATNAAWRRDEPLARYLHRPKLPEELSISIAAVVAPDLIGAEVALGPGLHDLVTLTDLTVAVKGTGPSRWITLTETDLAADRLVWVDYTDRILGGRPVQVLSLTDPGQTWKRPLRLTRAQLTTQHPGIPAVSYDPSRRVREAPTDTGKARHRGLSTAHKTVSSVRPIAALAPPSDARQDRMMRGLLSRVLGTGQARSGVRPSSTAILLSGDETLEVVGESHRQEELWRIVGSRQEDYVRFDVVAVLMPDPDNRYDPNAIEVRIDGTLVGYLSREDAAHYCSGLRQIMQTNGGRFVALHGVICGGGRREDARVGFLGVFLDHDPADFGLPSHHISTGHLRTGLSEAIATDLEDGSYDLSWLKSLSIDDEAAVQQLQDLLEGEDAPIDRHYMFCELEHRLYRLRRSTPTLDLFDGICERHHTEMQTIRSALVEKFGVVPVIELYRQAGIRCQKQKAWERARSWAERGLAVYDDQCARPEVVDDLRKRLAYAVAKIEAAGDPRPHKPRGSTVTAPREPVVEELLCDACGRPFSRTRVRGRKPKLCPTCRTAATPPRAS